MSSVDLLKGIRLQGPVVVLETPLPAGAEVIFSQSTNPAQIGTRTFRLKRVKGYNGAGADTLVHIGTGNGVDFIDSIPPLYTIQAMNFDFVEDDLPEVEWSEDMTCYAVACGVGTEVIIQVEVEEIG